MHAYSHEKEVPLFQTNANFFPSKWMLKIEQEGEALCTVTKLFFQAFLFPEVSSIFWV